MIVLGTAGSTSWNKNQNFLIFLKNFKYLINNSFNNKIKVLYGQLYFPDLQVTGPCLEMFHVLFSCFTAFLTVM